MLSPWDNSDIDHIYQAHDARRAEGDTQSIADQITDIQRLIASYERDLTREDWEFGPNAERERASLRRSLPILHDELQSLMRIAVRDAQRTYAHAAE